MSSDRYEEKCINETPDWVSPWTLLLRAIAKQKAKERSLEALLFSPSSQLKSEGKLSCQGKLLLALAISGFCAFTLASGVQARDYFVGLTGDNSDGLTPQTAWNELDQIKWEQIKDGDLVKIAGGTYHKTLKINFRSLYGSRAFQTVGGGVGISPSSNNDTVIIEGAPTTKVGVDFGSSSGVALASIRSDRLIVKNCPGFGVQFGPQSDNCYLYEVQVQDNYCGLKIDGNNNQIYLSNIHDNNSNVALYNTLNQPGNVATFKYVWIHGTKQGSYANGIYTASSVLKQLSLSNCVLGPGLSNGIFMFGGSAKLDADNCLFINSRDFNVRVAATSYTPNAINLTRCTSYMTPLNSLGRPHGAISLNTGSVNLIENIFYKGVVSLPPARVQVAGRGNVAFQTTGTPIPGVTTDPQLNDVLPGAKVNNPVLSDLVNSRYWSFNPSLPLPTTTSCAPFIR